MTWKCGHILTPKGKPLTVSTHVQKRCSELFSLNVNQQLLLMHSFWHCLVLSGKLVVTDSKTGHGGKKEWKLWEKNFYSIKGKRGFCKGRRRQSL